MKNLIILPVVFALVISACSPEEKVDKIAGGSWLFELMIDHKDPELKIPFNVQVDSSHQLTISNADEKIEIKEIEYRNDSVFIKMPVFGSEFKGVLTEHIISGEYWNYNKSKVSPIPFRALKGIEARFESGEKPLADFAGSWQVNFGSPDKPTPAIGIFQQDGNKISGTFKTEVGDYRYLEGIVSGNEMQVSCFDGAHAFLFTAVQNDNKIEGMFYSGDTWKQAWTAERSDNPQLGDMKTLTYLKPGYDKLSFTFPNAKGESVSLEDERYKHKVVIVQIFGTWCPNCMDETRYLVDLYNKYHAQGLEIIGLDFETKTDFDYFVKRITRYQKDLDVPYELLLAGPANKKLAAEVLPMLNKVISYPTAIFIDKGGIVREIHTGFTGPGTGEDYEHYKKETEAFIGRLLSE